MKLYNTKDKLPNDGKYVLVHLSDAPWHDSDDQEGCTWIVAKFVRGISAQEREVLLSNGDSRALIYRSGDEWSNNKRPYCWDTFGPSTKFGQDVDVWAHLPRGEYRECDK